MSSTSLAAGSRPRPSLSQAIAPTSALKSAEHAYCFDVPADFPIFGRSVGPPVAIVAAGNSRSLANWLAFNESPAATDDAMWASCIEQNPKAFSTLQAIELFDSSLDLPKGTVVFNSVEAPPLVKDNPPGEIVDRLSAVRFRYPAAKIWLHEPVYRQASGETPVLLTPEMLHDEAERARQAVWETYRETRRRFRVEFYVRRCFEQMRERWRQYQRCRAISRKATEMRSSYLLAGDRDDLGDHIQQARELGMHDEADFMYMTAYGSLGMSEEALRRARDFHQGKSGSFWLNALRSITTVHHSQFNVGDYAALASIVVPIAVLTLQMGLVPGLVLIDPVLTFTLPEDEDRHWLIGHWDWKDSPDGSKTLLYICA